MLTGLKEFKSTIAGLHDKIMYCEACGDNARVYLTNGDYWHLTCCLGKIESLLYDDNFFRCDKSFLVNHRFIKTVDFNTNLIILDTGEKIVASYRALKKISEYIRSKGYIIL